MSFDIRLCNARNEIEVNVTCGFPRISILELDDKRVLHVLHIFQHIALTQHTYEVSCTFYVLFKSETIQEGLFSKSPSYSSLYLLQAVDSFIAYYRCKRQLGLKL